MANPFEKRATEYFQDDEAFLAIVTPEPLVTFLQQPAHDGSLYDRLAIIVGTPGSGKTTLARLFQFRTLMTLLRNRNMANHKPLLDTLTRCGAIEGRTPRRASAHGFRSRPSTGISGNSPIQRNSGPA